MKIPLLVLMIFCVNSNSFTQSMVLKGILINQKTNEPIPNARISILGGDSEENTTTFGEYRLDLKKGISCDYGDKIYVYVQHNILGFHKKEITISKSLQENISIIPDNLIKITGDIMDNQTKKPIKGITVKLISEENMLLNDENILNTKTDKFGIYIFLIDKSIIGNQRYVKLMFLDEAKNPYGFEKAVLNIFSPGTMYLKKNNPKKTSEKVDTLDALNRGTLLVKISKSDPEILTPLGKIVAPIHSSAPVNNLKIQGNYLFSTNKRGELRRSIINTKRNKLSYDKKFLFLKKTLEEIKVISKDTVYCNTSRGFGKVVFGKKESGKFYATDWLEFKEVNETNISRHHFIISMKTLFYAQDNQLIAIIDENNQIIFFKKDKETPSWQEYLLKREVAAKPTSLALRNGKRIELFVGNEDGNIEYYQCAYQ